MDETYIVINDTIEIPIYSGIQAWIDFLAQKPQINEISLKFRSHSERIKKGTGYYVGRGGFGFTSGGYTGESVFIGIREEDKLLKQLWQIPELVLIDEELVPINNYLESKQYYGVQV